MANLYDNRREEAQRMSILEYDPITTLNILATLLRIGFVFSLTMVPCMYVIIRSHEKSKRQECLTLWLCLLSHSVLQLFQLPLRCIIYSKVNKIRAEAPQASVQTLASRIRAIEGEKAWRMNQQLAFCVYGNSAVLLFSSFYFTFWNHLKEDVDLLATSWFLLLCFLSRIIGTFIWSWSYFSRQQQLGATSDELSRLKTATIAKNCTTNACVICMIKFEEGEKVSMLPCSEKHVFHTECVHRWLKVSKLCPLCMKQI